MEPTETNETIAEPNEQAPQWRPLKLWEVLVSLALLGAVLGTAKIWADAYGMDATFWGIYVVGGTLWLGSVFALVIWHRWRFGMLIFYAIAAVYGLLILVVKVSGAAGFACVAMAMLFLWAGVIGVLVFKRIVE